MFAKSFKVQFAWPQLWLAYSSFCLYHFETNLNSQIFPSNGVKGSWLTFHRHYAYWYCLKNAKETTNTIPKCLHCTYPITSIILYIHYMNMNTQKTRKLDIKYKFSHISWGFKPKKPSNFEHYFST